MTNEYEYLGTRVRGLNDANDYEVFDNSSAGPGGSVSPAVTPTVAFAIKRLTGLTGRGARGRVFFGPLQAAAIDADSTRVTAATANGLVDNMMSLLSTLLVAGFTEVVVQSIVAGVPLPEAIVRPVVTYAVTDFVLDNQRRRKPKSLGA
jgi:hypothetical protein